MSLRRLAPKLCATACIAAVGAAVAAGQTSFEPAGPWQASAFEGWYFGASPYVLGGAGSGEVRFDGAPAYGLRIGRDLDSGLGLELGWTRTQPERELTTGSRRIRRLSLVTYELDLKVSVGTGRLRGLATLGLGGATTGSSFGGANFSADAGLGLLVFLNRRLAIRLDGRSNWTYGNIGSRGSPAYCDAGGCYFYRRPWYPSATASAGLTYAF